MTYNDLLRSICDSMKLDADRVVEIFALVEHPLTERKVDALLAPDEATLCSEERLGLFLDGLIIDRRGPRDPSLPAVARLRLTNNEVLKKLRIAWNMKETELLATFASGGRQMTKNEVSGLFRKPGNKHYRGCSDHVLRTFLAGLAAHPQRDA